jgi:hypothetical protein
LHPFACLRGKLSHIKNIVLDSKSEMRKRSIYTNGKENWEQLYDIKLFVGLLKIAGFI